MAQIAIGQRLGSMILDHFFMTLIAAGISIPIMLLNFFIRRFTGIDLDRVMMVLIFVIYLNKDFFRGKSIAKRTIGLVVMKKDSTEVASRLQCFIRNLTLVLWPIEVLISLFSPQRRIGDLIAGTKIEMDNKEKPSAVFSELKEWFRGLKNSA